MILYLTTKFLAETAWCLVGLLWFRRDNFPAAIPSAARYGLVRLALAWLLVLAIRSLLLSRPEWFVWIGVLLPLRWAAWSIVGAFIARRELRLRALFPADRRSALWLAAGLFLSTLSDLPALLAGFTAAELWP